MVRVRFAPSPTGYVHVGSLRTALYNELFALHNGGKFILRIEDTDRTRYVDDAVENLLRTLAWSGIEAAEGPYLDADGQLQERGDFGPYVQSARTAIYMEHVAKLLAGGHAYRCFCSSETLEKMREAQAASGQPVMYDRRCRELDPLVTAQRATDGESHVIRLKVPAVGETSFEDVVRGRVVFENALIDDQVLLKSDGFPTYHLANVVDDHLMEITHVIRAEEWLPSTPKHLLLYAAFGWQPPTFAHVPLLLNADRSKLSKRQGDVAVEDYRKQGYLPEAMINFVALLGWNPTGDREIYDKDELVRLFDLGKVNKSGAVFNREKLDWTNREYLRTLDDQRLAEIAKPFCVATGLISESAGRLLDAAGTDVTDVFGRALSLERSRVDRLDQLSPLLAAYLGQVTAAAELLPWKKSTPAEARERLTAVSAALTEAPPEIFSTVVTIETTLKELIAKHGWGNGDTLWPMRVALTGLEKSPSPFEVAWALGRERSLRRLESAITKLA